MPKTIEKFNSEYESKIFTILSDNTNKSSEFLENIINNKIFLKDETYSEAYQDSITNHEELLIKFRQHIKIENMHEEIEELYHSLFQTIKIIKNLSYLLIIFNLIFLTLGIYLNFPSIITCGIYSLTFYGIFRIIDLYYQFKKEWDKLLNFY